MTEGIAEQMELPSKRMICLRKEANQGKTKTIKNLAKLLIPDQQALAKANAKLYKPLSKSNKIITLDYETWLNIFNELDICVVLDVNGKRVGLCSYGDIADIIRKCLKFLIDENCDIIICACRSKGETVAVVEKMAKEGGYTLIWSTPYTTPYTTDTPLEKKPTPLQNKLNQMKAEHLKDFIYE